MDIRGFFGADRNSKKRRRSGNAPPTVVADRRSDNAPPTVVADRPTSRHEPPVVEPATCSSRVEPNSRQLELGAIIGDCTGPNHSDFNCLPSKRISDKKTLHFKPDWTRDFPWLHCRPGMDGVVCFYCAVAESDSAFKLDPKRNQKFISEGFNNWSVALTKFRDHQKSSSHESAVAHFLAKNAPDIVSQISSAKLSEQAAARRCLVHLIRCVRYLLRQGLAMRGHTEIEGNFQQLLRLVGNLDFDMTTYLCRTTNFTSHHCSTEISRLFSHLIIRGLVQKIKDESGVFSIIADSTLDINMKEQLSICLRYVDAFFVVHEVFIGLYEIDATSGASIGSAIHDAILRVGLDPKKLRGQAYDGAANMSGEFNGAQAKVKENSPLALYFKCSAHTINLVSKSVCESDPIVEDALQSIHELGKLHKRSGKFHRIFQGQAAADTDSNSSKTIRPLCPTRFLCRRPAITAVLENYGTVLNSLYEMSLLPPCDTTTKARGLYSKFQAASTHLGLKIALSITGPLEELNQVSQAKRQTMSGFIKAAGLLKDTIDKMRNPREFAEILKTTVKATADFDLEPLELPRFRRPPKRYTGPAPPHVHATAEDHYRQSYYSVIDKASAEFADRFDPEKSAAVKRYRLLENVLLNGFTSETDKDVLSEYPEINVERLELQLKMFHDKFSPKTLFDVKDEMRKSAVVSDLFSEVKSLTVLLLVCPVSSCEAERSFSALRRLKTWLRSTINQERLNYASVCHCHKDELDNVNLEALAAEFASRSQTRVNAFGKF